MSILLEQKKIKCRKIHVCQGCGRQLQIDEIAIKSTISYSYDSIWYCYECRSCYEYHEKYCNFCKYFYDCIGADYEAGILKNCRQRRRLK